MHGFREALDPLGPAIKADNLRSYAEKKNRLVRSGGNLGRGTATDALAEAEAEVVVMQSGPVCVT